MDSLFFKFSFVLIGILLVAAVASIPYLKSLDTIGSKVEIKIGDQLINAEVASNAITRAQGLSGRGSIGVNEGMLFVFDKPGKHSFWMKGMKFPIDIVWIDEKDVIIGITKNVEPQPGIVQNLLKAYYPPAPAKRVLELKAGRTGLFRAGVGDVVRIRPFVQNSQQ
ncbi:MAG: DUF192 domain-containing protein [Candidatus Jorgensenbacteria bacterium]|nr:DUF192 domain-containing protein [Candidatus Jorgensenbacteria bacterium]